MLRFAGLVMMIALVAGCDPELNDPECSATAECSFRPGTVCSPEGWCVAPEAIRIDRGVTPMPDMRAPMPDAEPPANDLAVDMQAPMDGAASDDQGGRDAAVDLGSVDGSLNEDAAQPEDGGGLDAERFDGFIPPDASLPDGELADGESADALAPDSEGADAIAAPPPT